MQKVGLISQSLQNRLILQSPVFVATLINLYYLKNCGIPAASAYFGCFMALKSDHELIPVHELMSEKEVKELLQTLNLTIDSLPRILESDPQAIRLEAKAGRVIKIYRRDGKRETPYYRAVVEG